MSDGFGGLVYSVDCIVVIRFGVRTLSAIVRAIFVAEGRGDG